MKQIMLLIFILVIFSGNIYPQRMSLTECINYAHSHRIELQKQEHAQSYYAKQFSYSKYELLPSLSSEISYNFSKNKSIDQTSNSWEKQTDQRGSIGISVNMILFDGFQSINKLKQSKTLVARNNTYTESIKNTIKLEVIQVFYEVLMAKSSIVIAENAITTTKQQISMVEIAVNAGKTSEIDLLEVKAQLEKERSYLIDASKQYEQTLIRLRKTINYEEKTNLTIDYLADNNLTDKAINIDSIYMLSIHTLPEFRLAEYDSLYWTYAIKQVRGQYLPYLTGGAHLLTNYQKDAFNNVKPDGSYNLGSQLDNNLNKQLSLSLVIPIYNKHKVRSLLIDKEQQLKDINIDKEQLYKDIYFEIEQICVETSKKQENLKTLEKRFECYNEIYEMRNEQYKHGILSIIDLLIADSNKKSTELQLSYEKYSLLYKLEVINFYCGEI